MIKQSSSVCDFTHNWPYFSFKYALVLSFKFNSNQNWSNWRCVVRKFARLSCLSSFSSKTCFFEGKYSNAVVVLFKYLLIDIKMHLCLLQKFDNEYVIVKNSLQHLWNYGVNILIIKVDKNSHSSPSHFIINYLVIIYSISLCHPRTLLSIKRC